MPEGKITTIGREKLCKSHAGAIPLPRIAYMGFGTGGLGADGTALPACGTETQLKSEVLKKGISGFEFMSDTTCRYSARLEKNELVNVSITEQGLFDVEGDLIVYKTFLPKVKDDDMEFVFAMDEIF